MAIEHRSTLFTGMEPAVMVFAHLDGGVNRWYPRTEGHREVDFGPGFTPTDEAVRRPVISARDAVAVSHDASSPMIVEEGRLRLRSSIG